MDYNFAGWRRRRHPGRPDTGGGMGDRGKLIRRDTGGWMEEEEPGRPDIGGGIKHGSEVGWGLRREGGDGWMIGVGRDWTCGSSHESLEEPGRRRMVCVRKWWLGGGARILPHIN